MSNEKFSVFSGNLSRYARIYLCFVTAVFLMAGVICAGLYMNLFGFVDRVHSYIFAETLFHSLIRSMAEVALITFTLHLLSPRDE
jgi:hypothetical protein